MHTLPAPMHILSARLGANSMQCSAPHVRAWRLVLVRVRVWNASSWATAGLVDKADSSLMRAQCCRRVVEALEVVAASALEMLASMRLIRTFTKESAEKARFGSQVLGAYKVAKHMAVANGIAEGVGVLVVKVSVLGAVCQQVCFPWYVGGDSAQVWRGAVKCFSRVLDFVQMCLVLSIFYGASLVHHNDISGGILVSYSLIALQVEITHACLARRLHPSPLYRIFISSPPCPPCAHLLHLQSHVPERQEQKS